MSDRNEKPEPIGVHVITSCDPVPDGDPDGSPEWEAQGIWMTATDTLTAGNSFCSICGRPIPHYRAVAAIVATPYGDGLMMLRWVCRRCAPTEAQARALVNGLMPDILGGANRGVPRQL